MRGREEEKRKERKEELGDGPKSDKEEEGGRRPRDKASSKVAIFFPSKLKATSVYWEGEVEERGEERKKREKEKRRRELETYFWVHNFNGCHGFIQGKISSMDGLEKKGKEEGKEKRER